MFSLDLLGIPGFTRDAAVQTDSPPAADAPIVGDGGEGVEVPAGGAVAAGTDDAGGAEGVNEVEEGDVGGGGEPFDDPAPLAPGAAAEDHGAPGPSGVL